MRPSGQRDPQAAPTTSTCSWMAVAAKKREAAKICLRQAARALAARERRVSRRLTADLRGRQSASSGSGTSDANAQAEAAKRPPMPSSARASAGCLARVPRGRETSTTVRSAVDRQFGAAARRMPPPPTGGRRRPPRPRAPLRLAAAARSRASASAPRGRSRGVQQHVHVGVSHQHPDQSGADSVHTHADNFMSSRERSTCAASRGRPSTAVEAQPRPARMALTDATPTSAPQALPGAGGGASARD